MITQGLKSWSGCLCLALAAIPASAQNFPTKPLRMIVPYGAGGPTDVIARVAAPKLGDALGQAVLVENRPGAATLIGTRAALQAPADGYTLLFTANTMALNSLAYRNPGYKMSDFVPIAPIATTSFILSVKSSLPIKTLADFVAYARANPKKLNNVSLGSSSVTHLAVERFRATAGYEVTEVEYGGGSSAAAQALMAGVVDVFLDGTISAMNTGKSPQVRMLATTRDQRMPSAPDLPTFKELGYPNMVILSWVGVFASVKTPEPIVQKLSTELAKVASDGEVRNRLVNLGLDPWTGRAQDFPAFVKEDLALWEKDIRRAGIQLDE